MFKTCICIVLTVFICAVAVPACAQSTTPGGEEPRTVDVPSEEFATIGEAIEALANRSTIRLAPGVYNESIDITGKRIHIEGAGAFNDNPTEIFAADPEAAVVTYGPRGGGSISGVILRDGAFGVRGVSGIDPRTGLEERPAAVTVEASYICHVGQGLFGDFSSMILQSSIIRHIDWNAACIVKSDSTVFYNDVISDTEGVGILLFNDEGEGTITIAYTEFKQHAQGGLAIVGSAKDVFIDNCSFVNNHLAGIFLLNTGFVSLANSEVKVVHLCETPGSGSDYGDGLLVSCLKSQGYLEIDNCLFKSCERAGILIVQCDGYVQNITSMKNNYGVVLQGTVAPYFGDGVTVDGNTSEDYVTSGDLPVPNEPLPVPPAL